MILCLLLAYVLVVVLTLWAWWRERIWRAAKRVNLTRRVEALEELRVVIAQATAEEGDRRTQLDRLLASTRDRLDFLDNTR